MARLAITAELLLLQLFDGKVPDVTVHGASFDTARGEVLLDIAGPEVPNVNEVLAIVTVNASKAVEKVEFRARSA
jgi:hypothetical protein